VADGYHALVGIAAGSVIALSFRVLGMLLWGIVGILTARTLSVDERGVYASAVVVTTAVGGISSFAGATGYFVANRKRDAGEVVGNAMVMAVPFALTAAVAAVLSGPLIGGELGRIVTVSGLLLFPGIIRNTQTGVILASNQLVRYNVVVNLPVLTGFAFLATWVWWLDHRTAESALAAWTSAQYVALVPLLWWSPAWLSWLRRHRPSPALMRAIVRFTLVTGLGGIVGFLNYRIDLILVVSLDSREGAGIYSSAIAVAEALWLFSSAIAMASYARVARVDRAEAARVTATAVRHTLLVVVIGGIVTALVAPAAVELLFGRDYRDAATSLRILCLGTAMFAPQGLFSNYFTNQLGRPVIQLLLAIFALSTSVIAGVLLIPHYGTAGAAWSTTISYALSGALAVGLFLWLSEARLSDLWRVRSSDVASYARLVRDIASGRLLAGVRSEVRD
jgi:O-antigen/teichoic acid export membrane protein